MIALATGLALALPAMAQNNLTVVNFGGANGAAQQKAYIEPFEKANNTKITMVEYNGEMARIKAWLLATRYTVRDYLDTVVLFERLGEINRSEGLTMLVVEQNASLALAIAQRGYVLETGSIVASGSAQELSADEDVRKAYLGF
jgi:hypothetical protein